jgi:SAM-dependent methyltransferase
MSSLTKPAATSDIAPPPSPSAQFRQLQQAGLAAQLVEVVLEHQLARRLLDGPHSSTELAQMTGLHEPSLYRVLRALTMLGVFTEQPERRFALGRLGQAAAFYDDGFPWVTAAINELSRTLQSGTTGMELAHGMPIFEYLTRHPDAGRRFDLVMTAAQEGEPEAVAEAYDFTGVRTLVDVGGGNGTGLAVMLARHPHLHGVLFDLPAVIERGAPTLAALAERCDFVSGDFFASMPARGDAHLLSHVVHDWDDDRALTILRNCRDAMSPEGRLLLVEMVVPAGGEPHPAKMLDVVMLILTGGMERTEQQYTELLDSAGFRVARVIPTQSAVSVIEAVPTT